MRSLPVLLALACKPNPPLEPVYDCTRLTAVQQEDFSALIAQCKEEWECKKRTMQLYCEEMKRE